MLVLISNEYLKCLDNGTRMLLMVVTESLARNFDEVVMEVFFDIN